MGSKWVNVYRCACCGKLSADYQGLKLHILIQHPEIANPRDYIDFVFRLSRAEYEKRKSLYFIFKARRRKDLKKPNQALRLVF